MEQHNHPIIELQLNKITFSVNKKIIKLKQKIIKLNTFNARNAFHTKNMAEFYEISLYD